MRNNAQLQDDGKKVRKGSFGDDGEGIISFGILRVDKK
jgi:hypothetical protein